MKLIDAKRMNVSKCHKFVSYWCAYLQTGWINPCPCCGKEKICLQIYVNKLWSRFRLQCEDCNYLGRVGHTIIGAILSWNKERT